MKNKIRKTLLFKVCGLMCLIVCMLIGLLMFLHITLFEKYVFSIKESELIYIFDTLNKREFDNNYTSEIIGNLSLKYNVIIKIYDDEFNKQFDSSFPPVPTEKKHIRRKEKNIWLSKRDNELLNDVQNKLKTSSYVINKSNAPKEADVSFIDLIGILKNGNYVIASMPVSFIEESIHSTILFLFLSGISATLICLLFSYFLAKKITTPITEMSKITSNMAKLDFSNQCNYNKNDEIGILSNNINFLSEKLSNTIKNLHNEIDKVKKIDNTRKKLIANISHELKTPIFLIQSYSEGLKENIVSNDEDRNYYCDVIFDECNRMSLIVNELLDLSKIESGKIKLNFEIFDINKIIVSSIKNNNIAIKEKQIVVNYFENECFVKGDKKLIERVIWNLLTNAIDYTNKEENIFVNIEKFDNNKCHIKIENEGKNIPEDKINYIWESFYKTDESGNRQYGGTGIGLSIVKAIMDAHNQKYGVVNTSNGVCFYFELDYI